MIRLPNGMLSLDCNDRVIRRSMAMEKKYLGNSDEAVAHQKKVASALDDARKAGTKEHMAALKKYAGSIVSESIDYMLYASSIITSMFKVVTMTGTDVAAYHMKIVPEIDVWQLSAHGYPNAVVKLSSVTQYFPIPYRIGTDRIYQYLPSVLTGNPEPDEDINTQARYEIAQKVEDDLWILITAAIGAFANAWVYDTRIQDMPTSNSLDLSAEGGITKGWVQGLLAAVDRIPARTGSGIVTGDSAKIRNIIIPSNANQDLREWVSVVSTVAGVDASQDAYDTISPALQAEMERTGAASINTMWGEPLGIRKSKRLMGTSTTDWEKYAWVFLNGPVGRLIRWPAESRINTYDDRLDDDQEGIGIRETIAMDIPTPWCPNFLRVKIKP